MGTEIKRLNTVIRDVRQCYNVMKRVADDLHNDIGINASMRAVMESLHGQKKRAVPDIARAKSVSRQHIQVIMNRLLEDELVQSHSNPNDKRANLYSLTDLGEESYARILRREKDFLQDISQLFDLEELRIASKTIRKISDTLKGTEHE